MVELTDILLRSFPILKIIPRDLILGTLIIIGAALVLAFLVVLAAVSTYIERKVAAHIQARLGPMRVGWHGLLQFIADPIKLLLKEDIIPTNVDKPLFILAPYIVFCGSFGAFAALPFSSRLYISNLNVGIFYIMAVTSLVVIGIIMAGWSSNSKWSLFGAMRSAAQIVSYEIPVALAILVAVSAAGSLNLRDIVQAQGGGIHRWFVFRSPFLFLAFFLYFVSSLAEVNRTPFDLPEAESELVAGYHTEYSGLRFAFFFLSEYVDMFLVGAIATSLFLGGWNGPVFYGPISGAVIFIAKAYLLVLVMMWIRWTVPRLRVDQLMHMSWKVLTPFAFACLLGQGAWMVLW